MNDVPHLTYWMGRDIRELTRAELIEALEYSCREHKRHIESSISSMRLMGDLMRARRRGIKYPVHRASNML